MKIVVIIASIGLVLTASMLTDNSKVAEVSSNAEIPIPVGMTLGFNQMVVQVRDGVVIAEYPTLEDAAIITNFSEQELQEAILNQTSLLGDTYLFK